MFTSYFPTAYRMNAAIRKGTWQPSKKSAILMSANAIDGDKNPSLNADSSVYTQKGKNRWWAVNLERRYQILTVVVTMANTGSKSGCFVYHWPLRVKFFIISTIYIIPPHWHGTGSWNPSSCGRRTCIVYTINIIGADILATQGARAQQP